MSDVSALAKSSMESLGRGAFLVTLLPSVVAVLSAFAFFTSDLYPGSAVIRDKSGAVVPPGFAAIVHTADGLGTLGLVLALIAAVCLSVLLRPFQIAFVQFLEGYWEGMTSLSVPRALMIERHARRMSYAEALQGAGDPGNAETSGKAIVAYSRWQAGHRRRVARGRQISADYPHRVADVLPTALGNVLRRGETTAGERYGLATVESYPRLFPYLSAPVRVVIAAQLDLLDTTAAFVFVLLFDSALSAPLLWRWDRWAPIPLCFLMLAWLSNFGAVRAARRYALSLQTAFDLHRFDMLSGLHLELPTELETEWSMNRRLSGFFAEGDRAILAGPDGAVAYDHEHTGGSEQPGETASSG